jgi:hypothetical protein
MSDTTEAVRSRLRDSAETVELVCEGVRSASSGPEADVALGFARAFLSRAPVELLRGRPVPDLVGMTLGAYRFLRASSSNRVDVQVINPTAED